MELVTISANSGVYPAIYASVRNNISQSLTAKYHKGIDLWEIVEANCIVIFNGHTHYSTTSVMGYQLNIKSFGFVAAAV